MISNPFYTPEIHGPCELFDLGDFVLEEGYTRRVMESIAGHLGELLETSA